LLYWRGVSSIDQSSILALLIYRDVRSSHAVMLDWTHSSGQNDVDCTLKQRHTRRWIDVEKILKCKLDRRYSRDVDQMVAQRWVSTNPWLNLTCCFGLCICARLIISKLQRSKLLPIQTRFLKKHFQFYRQAVTKFALTFRLT
jgi:hypothetical protein